MGTVTDPAVEDTGGGHDEAPNPSGSSNGVPSEESKTPAIEFSPAPPAGGIRRASTAGTGLFSFLSGGGNGGNGTTGIPRHSSGSGIPRQGSGIPRHGSGIPRQGSGSVGGGIHRARSGVHLPSLTSISFSMSRLPEEDAGMQMHFTTMKDPVDSVPESGYGDDDEQQAAPRKPKNRMRKHLTAVGACSFGFRLAECVLSLISFIVMCANSQNMGTDFGTLKFNHFQAYKYLVAVNIVVFVYSTFQFIQLLYTVILGISFIPSILLSTWLTFAFDQLFCYLLLSASTSAATVANMSYTGEMGTRFCSRYDLGSFCAKADAAVTMSFFTFLAMLSSTILAIYRIAVLLREY